MRRLVNRRVLRSTRTRLVGAMAVLALAAGACSDASDDAAPTGATVTSVAAVTDSTAADVAADGAGDRTDDGIRDGDGPAAGTSLPSTVPPQRDPTPSDALAQTLEPVDESIAPHETLEPTVGHDHDGDHDGDHHSDHDGDHDGDHHSDHDRDHDGDHDGAESEPGTDGAGETSPGTDSQPGAASDSGDRQAGDQQSGDQQADEPRAGEVHVHEDGYTHTHGAGAPKTWTVVYRNDPSDGSSDGQFVPERLDIITGDTVKFVNESTVDVWPASNIHPTHEVLSSFDPLDVVPPGQSWSYTFTENGYWRYHNHVWPSEVGLVVATGGPEDDLAPLDLNMTARQFPTPAPGAGGVRLMDDVAALEHFVVTYGPAAVIADLEATEASTGRDCHNAAHEVGRVAFEEFGPVAFALAGHDCQAGALHGAIEALFSVRGTARLAEDVAVVCSAAENAFVLHQCLHGVGHGLMAWTTYEIHEALDLCDVLEAAYDRESCYSGVFMENVVGGLSGLMGHSTEYLRPDDPHFPCDVVAEQYMPGCYFYQTSHMVSVFGGDMEQVAGACSEAPAQATHLCFASYGRDVSSATRNAPATAVQMCSYVPTLWRGLCVNGAAQDRFWEPSGAAAAVALCALAGASEADGCWDTIIERAGFVLTSESQRRSLCDQIPAAGARGRCTQALL